LLNHNDFKIERKALTNVVDSHLLAYTLEQFIMRRKEGLSEGNLVNDNEWMKEYEK